MFTFRNGSLRKFPRTNVCIEIIFAIDPASFASVLGSFM